MLWKCDFGKLCAIFMTFLSCNPCMSFNLWIKFIFSTDREVWIGLYQPKGVGLYPELPWTWINDSVSSWLYWDSLQPSDSHFNKYNKVSYSFFYLSVLTIQNGPLLWIWSCFLYWRKHFAVLWCIPIPLNQCYFKQAELAGGTNFDVCWWCSDFC